MNWEQIKIGDVCEKVKTCNPIDAFNNKYFNYIDISAIDANEKEIIAVKSVLGNDAPSRARQIVVVDDVLISTVRPNLNAVALIKNEDDKSIASTGFCVLRPIKNKLNSRYLFYWVQSKTFVKKMVERATGASYPAVSDTIIKSEEIPLPPLPTQQHIAAILDKADELRKKDKQLLAQYDALLQSVFYDMFGDPVFNENGWDVKKNSSVLIGIVAGTSYGGEERELLDDELGVLKISAVTLGYFKSQEYKAVKKAEINKVIISPKKGDLLFSRANTQELVGATCIVDNDYPKLFLPDKLWRIDLDLNQCNQHYFKNLLSDKTFKNNLTKTATGTSGSMLNISMEKLKSLQIPLPPISLQNKFASIAQNIQQQKQQVKEQMEQSEKLFQGLLQKAFNGELVA